MLVAKSIESCQPLNILMKATRMMTVKANMSQRIGHPFGQRITVNQTLLGAMAIDQDLVYIHLLTYTRLFDKSNQETVT